MKKCFFVLLLFLCSLQPIQGLAATKVSFNIGNTCRQQAVAKGTYSKQQEKDCWEKERKDEGIEVFGRAEGVHLKQGADGIPVAEICRRAGIS